MLHNSGVFLSVCDPVKSHAERVANEWPGVGVATGDDTGGLLGGGVRGKSLQCQPVQCRL